jgi:hypothetical protein
MSGESEEEDLFSYDVSEDPEALEYEEQQQEAESVPAEDGGAQVRCLGGANGARRAARARTAGAHATRRSSHRSARGMQGGAGP